MMSKRSGFTLVELLVVMAIISVLAAMLLPALTRARESARSVACRSNLKQIGLAFGMYQEDYDEYFPSCDNTGWPVVAGGWGKLWPSGYADCHYHHPLSILAHDDYVKAGWTDNSQRVRDSVLACPSDRAATMTVTDSADNVQCKRAHIAEGLTISYNVSYQLSDNITGRHRAWSRSLMRPGSTMLAMDNDWHNNMHDYAFQGCIRCCGVFGPDGPVVAGRRLNTNSALQRHGGAAANVLWADLHVSLKGAFEWNSTRAFSRFRTGDMMMGQPYPNYHESVYFLFPMGIPM
jgi:prepilin-type N-terminal cleavage/methylation domain-containing protein/prepilin-type processing-associated H-X9-DG protein